MRPLLPDSIGRVKLALLQDRADLDPESRGFSRSNGYDAIRGGMTAKEEGLKMGSAYFIAVFIDIYDKFFPSFQYVQQSRVTAACRKYAHGVQQRRFADAVSSRN